MSFKIQAPYPTLAATTILPSPIIGDNENLKNRLDIHRSMTGVRRTYVNSFGRSALSYNFNIVRAKAQELEEFIKAYNSSMWKVTTHTGTVWHVYLTNNPFQFTSVSDSGPGREVLTVQLQLEGTKQ